MTTTREEAIEMSREAGFYYDTGVIERHLERFIRLIDLARAKENEACAKVCDRRVQRVSNGQGISYQSFDPASVMAQSLSEAIRARMK